MDERRWEDLEMDSLMNILGRVGMESLLLDVPYVCKSWYMATPDPQCWKQLIFPKISLRDYDRNYGRDFPFRLVEECKLEDEASIVAFTKFVINRSGKTADHLQLPQSCCTEEKLLFAANECPDLTSSRLPSGLSPDVSSLIPNIVSKFQRLELLMLYGLENLTDIVTQISRHCKKFIGLVVYFTSVGEEEASAIVNLLPNLQYLVLRNLNMEKDTLVSILQGCKQLCYFNGQNCRGFHEYDEDIKRLASHIPKFTVKGSMLYDWDWDDSQLSSRDFDF